MDSKAVMKSTIMMQHKVERSAVCVQIRPGGRRMDVSVRPQVQLQTAKGGMEIVRCLWMIEKNLL